MDEVEARMRWETANADGKNAAFDPAVPGPRFKAPDKAAAVARALPFVTAAYRSEPLLPCPALVALLCPCCPALPCLPLPYISSF